MKIVCWGFSFLIFCFPLQLHAENRLAYLSHLKNISKQKGLYKNKQWLRLLHYHPLAFDGESEVESPSFFNAPDGAENPASELEATLEIIFDPAVEQGNAHGICRFPARFLWLKQQLQFNPKYIPWVECKSYNAWKQLLNAKSVSLVFASSYMGNPASAFGHTFLKFNQKKGNTSLNLLAHVVQYQAITEDSIGLIYALKGLFGGYRGYYVLNPYYTPILSNIEYEDRSIWEYELNLTPDELEMLIRHSWEMAHASIPYYFTLENCSYRSLELVEVAAPRYSLKEAYYLWTLPTTTVRDALAQGLVSKMNYFPARTRQLLQKFNAMEPEEQEFLLELVEDPQFIHSATYQMLSNQRKVLLLDTALDYLRSRLNEDFNNVQIKKKRRFLLQERSRFNKVVPVALPSDLEEPLQKGHHSNRFQFGVGGNAHESFFALGIRAAYHDLLANETGHLENSQLIIGDLKIRYFTDHQWVFHELDVISVFNLAPINLIRQDWSWRTQVAIEPSTKRRCRLCRKGIGEVGIGYSWDFQDWPQKVTYLMANATLELDDAYSSDYLIGGGILTGILLEWTPQWKTHIEFQNTKGVLGDFHYYFKGKFHQHWSVGQNQDLRIELNYLSEWELFLAFNYYY